MKLKECRDALGWSQAQLARYAGLEPSAISHFETGRRTPSIANLIKLADALTVTTDTLLGRKPLAAGETVTAFLRRLLEDREMT